MKRHPLLVYAPTTVALLVGCGNAEILDPIGVASKALEAPNALNPNALNPNALNPNALNPNALNPNALSPSTLSSSALSAIQDSGEAGDLSRELLRYVVGCAFDPTQSFSFSWTDVLSIVHNEVYYGELGLATSWQQGGIDASAQRWVTACLLSRTNWYGVSVMLSSRGSHAGLKKSDTSELTQYPMEEGAFWGNLFAQTPVTHACYYAPNIAHSRSLLRDCAAGHIDPVLGIVECGILDIAGDCGTYCDPLHPSGLYHANCYNVPGNGATKVSEVITVFLP